MPNPRPGESRDDFLDRCIPEVVAEGREPDQAVAMCIAFYEGEKDKAFNIKDENRIEYWKSFDRRRVTFENKFTRVFTRAFKEQLSIYEDAYTINDLKRDISTKPIEDAFVSLYTEVGDVFARNTWAGLKRLPFIETKQQPDWIERMIQAAKTDASARIVGITETTRKQVNAIIVAGLEEGLGIEEIKRRIIGTRGVPPLNGTLQQRARRIARTEIVSASNKGSLEGALSTNLPFQKQWLSTPDNRTRDSHAEADGQTVDKREKFRVRGEELEYPGDPRGSAGNVINCRCTQIYVTGDTVTSDTPQIVGDDIVGIYAKPSDIPLPESNSVKDILQAISDINENIIVSAPRNANPQTLKEFYRAIKWADQEVGGFKTRFVYQYSVQNPKGRIRAFGSFDPNYVTEDGKRNGWGKLIPDKIQTNSFEDRAGYNDILKYQSSTGHFFDGITIESVMSHELGHYFDTIGAMKARGFIGKRVGNTFEVTSRGDFNKYYATRNSSKDIIRQAFKNLGVKDADLPDDITTYPEYINLFKKYGKYASIDEQEFLAMAMQYEYTFPGSDRLAQQIAKLTFKRYRDAFR